MDSLSPDTVRTAPELALLLKLTRVVRLDNQCYDRMAVELDGKISKSELGRLFSGEDFPYRKQLNLLLDLFGFSEADRVPWHTMWERLATERFTSSAAPVDQPTGPSVVSPPSHSDVRVTDPDAAEDLVERGQRIALRVVDDAITEAERILRGARTSAEDERQTLLNDARAAASRILTRAADEQAVLIRNAEQRIAAAFETAEGSLRKVVTELNDSVTDTAGRVRDLVDEVRSSVATIHDNLTSLRQDVGPIRHPDYLHDNGFFGGGEAVAPAVIGHPKPDYGPAQPYWSHGEVPKPLADDAAHRTGQ